MIYATIGKLFTFAAAHRLPNHDGKCAELHGHTYTVEVIVSGNVNPIDGAPDEGMVMDFGKLSKFWKLSLEPQLDHKFLNDVEGLEIPTAEHLAWELLGAFHQEFEQVKKVRVWETPTSWAEARWGDSSGV